ncbi:MAG: hypothetical protein AB7P03_08645 [Kofleriaceae bacterium]
MDEDDEAYLDAITQSLEALLSVLGQSSSAEEAALLELLADGNASEAIPEEPGDPDIDTERLLERTAALAELVLGEPSPLAFEDEVESAPF